MTPEKQRIAIAEACGWKPNGAGYWHKGEVVASLNGESADYECIGIGGEATPALPDYLNDLNAMHEAEKTLAREDLDLYADQLLSLIHEVDRGYFHRLDWAHGVELLTASASRRAEAFIRTIGKWKK